MRTSSPRGHRIHNTGSLVYIVTHTSHAVWWNSPFFNYHTITCLAKKKFLTHSKSSVLFVLYSILPQYRGIFPFLHHLCGAGSTHREWSTVSQRAESSWMTRPEVRDCKWFTHQCTLLSLWGPSTTLILSLSNEQSAWHHSYITKMSSIWKSQTCSS